MNNYPDNWECFGNYAPLMGVEMFGFTGDIGDVNRFAARFRAAKSFRGVQLDGYSDNTILGYSALCRVLFVWSAFESFLRIVDIRQCDSGPLLESHGGLETLSTLRQLDQGENFYQFLYERVNNPHKAELDSFRNNDACNIAYLASAIRHVFAHGHLTPSANSVEPVICIGICDRLSEFLLDVMNREFRGRVADFIEGNDRG